MAISFQGLTSVAICNIHCGSDSDSEPLSFDRLFFSLHSKQDELLYVSEEVPFASNANFGAIALPAFCGNIYTVRLKLWSLRHDAKEYRLLFDMYVDSYKLVCPGQIIDETHLKTNSVIFGFLALNCVLKEDINDSETLKSTVHLARHARASDTPSRDSYTFDQIRRIGTLANGINDYCLAKSSLSDNIDKTVPQSSGIPTHEELTALKVHLHNLHRYVAKQRIANDDLLASVLAKERQVKSLESCLEEEARSYVEILTERIEIVKSEVDPLYEALKFSVFPDLLESLRSIFMCVQEVIPITLVDSTQNYSIAGIETPKNIQEILAACYDPEAFPADGSSIDCINAGLSITVHLMLHISSIMEHKLKYNIIQSKSEFYLVEFTSQRSQKADSKHPSDVNLVAEKYPLFYDPAHSEKVAKTAGPVKSYELRNQRFERGLLLLKKTLLALSSDVMDDYSMYLFNKTEGLKLSNHIPIDCVENFAWTLNYLMLFMTAPLP